MGFPLLSSGGLNSLTFGIYGVALGEVMKVQHHQSPSASDSFICGCVAGFVQISICCPVDLVKIKLQLQTGAVFP
jgi:hypothetical protein